MRGQGSNRGICPLRTVGGIVCDSGEGTVVGRPGRGTVQALEVWKQLPHGRQDCVVRIRFCISTRHWPCCQWFPLWCRREAASFSNPWEGSVVRLPVVPLHGSQGEIIPVSGRCLALSLYGKTHHIGWPLAYTLSLFGVSKYYFSHKSVQCTTVLNGVYIR